MSNECAAAILQALTETRILREIERMGQLERAKALSLIAERSTIPGMRRSASELLDKIINKALDNLGYPKDERSDEPQEAEYKWVKGVRVKVKGKPSA